MIEPNKNFNYLKSFLKISYETFTKLQQIATYREFEPNTMLVASGEMANSIYLINQGVVRGYLKTSKGKELNKQLFIPISFAGALSSLIRKKPSSYSYKTITHCKLYEIEFKEINRLKETDIEVNVLYTKLLEHVFIQYERRNYELLALDATERYIALRKQIPNIDNLIPQYQIASYLGITPVQLSRIRKNMY